MTSVIHCAIGDIHGELARLKDLHRLVLDHAHTERPDATVQFVHLGDLIDRGEASCGVIEYLMAFEPAPHPKPVTLRGNHEQMMIDALASGNPASAAWRSWLWNGGDATLESYPAGNTEALEKHAGWLAGLPTIYRAEAEKLVFVHAGVDPDRFPECDGAVHMWTRRQEFFDPRCWTAPELIGQRVVHGHTPTVDSMPQNAGEGRRLNIDTGAVYGGRLTAALLEAGKPDRFFHA
jgi:serine/threonine protein phosphatase 1